MIGIYSYSISEYMFGMKEGENKETYSWHGQTDGIILQVDLSSLVGLGTSISRGT
jgi:hypothetical protein